MALHFKSIPLIFAIFKNNSEFIRMLKNCFVTLLCVVGVLTVNPDRPRSPCGSRSPSPADCNGLIGFSAKGLGRVHSSGLASYKKTLANPGGGFFLETGEYNVNCPGFYLISFASYPASQSSSGHKLTLKKNNPKNSGWQELVSTGVGGGSNQIILQLESCDQIGVFYSSSKESTDSSTFSAYRLTQK